MGSAPSNTLGDPVTAFKILVAGGFGAGKTTLVGAISEVRPLQTEEALSSASIELDDLTGVGGKTTTTVAMDFGRITIGQHLVLYLFGTPGQERFWFMWDELSYGALGAVVLADTRRLHDCFPSVDYFEKRDVPFVVAINDFENSPQFDPQDIRVALDLDPSVPSVMCDARELDSVKQVLIELVEHVLASGEAKRSQPPGGSQPSAGSQPAAGGQPTQSRPAQPPWHSQPPPAQPPRQPQPPPAQPPWHSQPPPAPPPWHSQPPPTQPPWHSQPPPAPPPWQS